MYGYLYTQFHSPEIVNQAQSSLSSIVTITTQPAPLHRPSKTACMRPHAIKPSATIHVVLHFVVILVGLLCLAVFVASAGNSGIDNTYPGAVEPRDIEYASVR
jgi:hypothetical protein